jgi:hypothetical protein
MVIIGCTPGRPAQPTDRRTDMALDDDDMTAPPEEPDSGTPADRAEGTVDDGGADGGDDPTTESEDDRRFA